MSIINYNNSRINQDRMDVDGEKNRNDAEINLYFS